MEVKIIAKTENPIETMWVAARTCYSEAGPITLFANIESEYEQLGKNFKDINEYRRLLSNEYARCFRNFRRRL